MGSADDRFSFSGYVSGMPLLFPGLPPLNWTGAEGRAEIDAKTGELRLQAEGRVDWTNDAGGAAQQHSATALAFAAPEADFVLSARVQVAGARSTFDAGALALWSDRDHWAKLCNEFSPQGDPMVVSVVTNGFSDDCNSALIEGAGVFLRVARIGPSIAFHSSVDGTRWDFVRVFRLPLSTAPLSAGFLAQAPMGDGCVASFCAVSYEQRTLADLRDGS
jgi:regulation of enolase protein 1 (concanavalin A-like superfamily)